ncbi:MAG: lycopene cyclase family protein [Cyclobacteriaceae bacterium]|nr:lycopene cyclase family protein [Cyclobacteriaceae bacterium]
MSSTSFDIAIIGAGAAGLQLALTMKSEPFFQEKRILIIEKSAKDQNDRTWCFWEKNGGKYDEILQHSWSEGDFFSKENTFQLSLAPYRYKMLRAIDFYRFAKKEIADNPNFHWHTEDVQSVQQGTPLLIIGQQGSYTANFVFDSRLPDDFYQKNDKYTRLLQHFKGWIVRTPDDQFDPNRFTLMDFRLRWQDTTSFTYVLPINKREALVEFTLFTAALLHDDEYDHMLQTYVSDVMKLNKFEIVETEQGVIPMSDFPFERYSHGQHVRIGTGGGWVKPSSGYSFKNCERNSRIIVENLINGRPANNGIISPKFRLYDAIFLDVLNRRNHIGPKIFEKLYRKNAVQNIFAFLDDQTTIADDLSIIIGFPQLLFLRSLVNHIVR